jgi:lipid A 3-O-deacylase
MRSKFFILLSFSIISFQQLMAQSHAHEAGIQSDNDSYLAQGSDRYYTNGLFLFYRQSLGLKDTSSSRLANKVLGS